MDVVEGRGRKGYGAARGRDSTGGVLRARRSSASHSPEYDRSMRTPLVVLGILLLGSGLVWMAQGLNLPFAPRSFMTSDRSWIVIGAVAAVAGGVLIGRARRST